MPTPLGGLPAVSRTAAAAHSHSRLGLLAHTRLGFARLRLALRQSDPLLLWMLARPRGLLCRYLHGFVLTGPDSSAASLVLRTSLAALLADAYTARLSPGPASLTGVSPCCYCSLALEVLFADAYMGRPSLGGLAALQAALLLSLLACPRGYPCRRVTGSALAGSAWLPNSRLGCCCWLAPEALCAAAAYELMHVHTHHAHQSPPCALWSSRRLPALSARGCKLDHGKRAGDPKGSNRTSYGRLVS
jgi:hypothetical protein